MKSKVEKALDLIRGKLATGATIFGHEVEQIEAALVEAVKAEKSAKEKS